MARSYLDKIGLSHLWDLFKAYLMRRNLVPEQSKTFEGVIATANSDPAGFLYFGQVKPDDYYIPYKIKYHMEIEIAGLSSTTQSKSDFNVEIRGLNNTYYGYRIDNVVNTNYRSIYGHIFYPCTLTGYNKGYGGLVGIRLQSAYNPANTANARIVKIEILETENCTFKFFDSMTLYANVEGSGSANYYSRYILDGTTNGHKVYGDANDVNYYNRNYYGNRKAAAPIYRYQLCVSKKDRSVLSLSTVDNNVSTNKTLTTESFDPFGDILYWNSGTTYTTGANVDDGWYNQYLADIRYTFNIGGNSVASTLVARKPLYLVTVLQSDGNVKLHSSPLAQDLPTTEDGLLYIYLGQMYPDTNPYRLYMSLHHPIYLFKNGHITNYTNNNDFVSVEQQPYSFRKSGGGVAVGDTEYDKIVGGTVCWNQWVQNGNFADGSNKWAPYNSANVEASAENGVLTAHFLNDSDGGYQYGVYTDYRNSDGTLRNPITGHVYMIIAEVKATATGMYGVDTNGTSAGKFSNVTDANVWTSLNKIFVAQNHSATSMIILPSTRITTADTMQIRNVMFIDLTAMFGSTIADYIYSLEQATAGAGVAFFKALFTNDYYPYNVGELVSVSGLSEHKMTGFNQWDEEWELGGLGAGGNSETDKIRSKNYIPVVSGNTYFFYCESNALMFVNCYDSDKNYLSSFNGMRNVAVTIPEHCRYIRFRMQTSYGTTYKNDICINLSNPAKNGTYEPYKAHSYPLDNALTLRGIPKLVDGKVCFDGDTYDADGKVTRRYGIVDLGTLNYSLYASGEARDSYTPYGIPNFKPSINSNSYAPAICSKFVLTYYSANWNVWEMCYSTANVSNNLRFMVPHGAYESTDAFKTAMSGVMLVYELATPTTEQATPYQNPQSVNEYGTEEYVSTSIIPIGHYTEYPASKTLIKNVTNNYNDIATQNKMGYMSASDKTKLDGIETGAEVNQNTFSNVKVGTTTISADTKTDTLELSAGTNITLTPDATNDKVTINATDTKYSAGNGIGLNGTVFSNTGVTGVKGNSESTYKTGNVNLTADQVGAIPKNTAGNTQNLSRPLHLNGLNDNTLDSKINTLRANRLAFLPADQIIIEKTTDGGTTWVDAGVADSTKIGLFSETRAYISIPLLNGVRSLECGLRITITAMKYNVPSGTAETSKYNYWNSNYVITTERYNQLKEMYFWVSAVNDTISIKVERATGAKPNNWSVVFEDTSWGATGWSGNDYVRFSQNTFGGGTTQTSNYWNYRITFMTRGVNGGTTLATSYTASSQSIMEIRGYGDTWWAAGNNYAANDCLYSHDYLKNATFPANVSASGFNGKLTGDVTGNVTGNVTGDVTGKTSSMLIQNIALNANLNTITTDGWYMASTDAIASSLSNCPSTKSFLMEVYHINSATGSNEVIYQKISTSENVHYERVKSGGVWSEWKSSCHIDLNGVVYI